jgi:small neutral amino acid transporter SnatA (MarC family)
MRRKIAKYTAIVLAAFGLITMFLSGSNIFDLFGVRAKQGNYVLLSE